jgi:hypothetical protein
MSIPSSTQANISTQTPEAIPTTQKSFSERATTCISRAYTVMRKIESLVPPLLKVIVSVAKSIATIETFAHLASNGWDLPSHSFIGQPQESI